MGFFIVVYSLVGWFSWSPTTLDYVAADSPVPRRFMGWWYYLLELRSNTSYRFKG